MEYFMLIVTKGDNIPIVMMIPTIAFFFLIAVRQMRANDRRIKAGQKERIYDEMNKNW